VYHASLNAADTTHNLSGARTGDSLWLLLLATLVLAGVILGVWRRWIIRSPNTQTNHLETQWLNAIEFLDEPIVLVDKQDRIVRANRAYYRINGISSDDVNGQKATAYCHPPEVASCPVCEIRDSGKDATITLEANDPCNVYGYPTEIRFRAVRDRDGNPIGTLQHNRNLSQTREAEKLIRKSETQFRALLETAPDPLIISDANGNIILVNKRCENVLGYTQNELIGQSVEILVPHSVRHRHETLRNTFKQSPSARPLGNGQQLIAQCKNGDIIPVDISLSPLEIDDELFISAIVRDVSEQKRYERELKRLASFPHLSPMPIIEVKTGEHCPLEISYLNPQAEFLFPDLLLKNTDHEILNNLEHYIKTARQTGKPQTRVIEIGEQVFEQQISYVADVEVAHINLWDVTTMHQLTNEMTYQASHDSLTGLVNRAEFERRIRAALQQAEAEDILHVFCFIDLDRFKIVNDQCGHSAGDALLKQLAKIIKSKTRSSDTLARLGGDEFGLLLEGCEMERGLKILQTIVENITAYRFIFDDKSFSVGASAGLVTLSKHSGNISHVMQAADSACYVAKNDGGGRVHVYQPDDQVLAQHTQNIQWAHKIQTALEKNQFRLYAQSIHSLTDPQEILHEILIRMIDEDGSVIPPGAFIPAAERYHLIQSIDRWVVEHTFQSIESGLLQGGLCTINLSGDSIGDPGMLGFVMDMFNRYQVTPSGICFEITETAMVTNLVQTTRFIARLRALGCKFALDDFGSGVSSFAYLQNLEVDILKIDGALVRAVAYNKVNEVMVSSINTIGHTMHMKTVAEFVENEDIMNKLTTMGIDYGQGYYFSRPQSVEEQFLVLSQRNQVR
jgi:diguanylate cyclase (GGDEF)-like protein/PAS domain S-box-containing protein